MFDQRQKRLAAIAALAVFIVALGAGREPTPYGTRH